MAKFRRKTTAQPRSAAADATPSRVQSTPADSAVLPARAPWSDTFGITAIRAVQVIAIVILMIGAIWLMWSLSIVVIPAILALIIACAFAPVTTWLRKHNVQRGLAAAICLLAVVVLLTAAGWLITNAVRSQWPELASQAQKGIEQVVAWSQQFEFLNISQHQIDEWIATATDFLTSSSFANGALAGAGAVTSFLTGLVLMVVILFYFLADGPRIWAFVTRPFHGVAGERAERIGKKSVDTMGAYVRGTAAVAAVDAIGIGIGLWICQVPLAFPLAVLVFILAFIPIVGATLAGILAALVALVANGPVTAIIVVAIVIGVNQLEGNFLQPVLMGRSLKLHSLVILIALAIGTAVGGIIGAIIAVPITAVLWGIVLVWDGPDTPAVWARPKPQAATK